jgi:hypothetical protein
MNITQKLVVATSSIVLSFTVIGAKPVQAITLIVTNTSDDISDTGSLRYAIDQANKTFGIDTIDFSLPTLPLTIKLTGESLDITSDLNINGPGANLLTIDGNLASSVLSIGSSSTVGIFGLTIANGNNGILNQGNLTVTNSIISGNRGTDFFANSGIFSNSGNLTVTNSTFFDNGAGIFGFNSNLAVTDSTFYGNDVGISSTAGSNITATNNTIFGNNTGISGSFSDIAITNNTISGNNGTGIGSFRSFIRVTNSTIFGNQGVGISNNGGYGDIEIKNSIVAKNSRDGIYPDIFGFNSVTDLGNNLIGTGAAFNAGFPLIIDDSFTNGVNGNIVGTLANPIDPLLGPLANNGGPTQTHALLPGSPAIDAANPNSFSSTDQRGVPRPQGAGPDIGAYELFQTPKSVPEPSNFSGILVAVGLGWLMKRKLGVAQKV